MSYGELKSPIVEKSYARRRPHSSHSWKGLRRWYGSWGMKHGKKRI
jgi:hypothetical protein